MTIAQTAHHPHFTTGTLDTGIAIAPLAEFVDEDRYIVFGEAVDLRDPIDPCSCGSDACSHIAAATVAQARRNRAAA
jgi:hypothetical protein